MALRAPKLSGAFEKRAPGEETEKSYVSYLEASVLMVIRIIFSRFSEITFEEKSS